MGRGGGPDLFPGDGRLRRAGGPAPVMGERGRASQATGRVLSLGAAAAGVAGLSMAQIVPTAEMLAESSRVTGLSYEEATRFSMGPLRLVHLVLPTRLLRPGVPLRKQVADREVGALALLPVSGDRDRRSGGVRLVRRSAPTGNGPLDARRARRSPPLASGLSAIRSSSSSSRGSGLPCWRATDWRPSGAGSPGLASRRWQRSDAGLVLALARAAQSSGTDGAH